MSNTYTIFRFFNVAGSDGENKQVGESTHLIRIAAETAAGKRDTMKIFGTDYDTRDGSCIRDYIHVVDLAHSIVKAVEIGPMNSPYECIGSGKGYTTIEVVECMKKVTEKDFEVIHSNRRAGDPPILTVENKSGLLYNQYTLEDMCLSAYYAELNRE